MDHLAHAPGFGGAGRAAGSQRLRKAEDGGERRLQVVRDVPHKRAHFHLRLANALRHRSERPRELAYLVAPLHGDFDVECALGHAVRGHGQLLDRAGDVARHDYCQEHCDRKRDKGREPQRGQHAEPGIGDCLPRYGQVESVVGPPCASRARECAVAAAHARAEPHQARSHEHQVAGRARTGVDEGVGWQVGRRAGWPLGGDRCQRPGVDGLAHQLPVAVHDHLHACIGDDDARPILFRRVARCRRHDLQRVAARLAEEELGRDYGRDGGRLVQLALLDILAGQPDERRPGGKEDGGHQRQEGEDELCLEAGEAGQASPAPSPAAVSR